MVSDDGGKEVFWSILGQDITSRKIKQIFIEYLPLTWVNYLIDPIISSFPQTKQHISQYNFYSGLVRHIRRLPAALLARFLERRSIDRNDEWMNGWM